MAPWIEFARGADHNLVRRKLALRMGGLSCAIKLPTSQTMHKSVFVSLHSNCLNSGVDPAAIGKEHPLIKVVERELRGSPRTWLVTGVAGFIGSNLLEALLGLDQAVVGIDNLATGHLRNLEEVRERTGPNHFARFTFLEADIRDAARR